MPEPLRIVNADDNYLVREGVRRLLEDSGDIVVAAAAGSAPELLDAVERLRPAAVLTDIRMPAGQRVPGERLSIAAHLHLSESSVKSTSTPSSASSA